MTNQPPITNKPNNNYMILVILGGIVGIGVLIFYLIQETPDEVAEDFFNYTVNSELEKAERLISDDADASVRAEFSAVYERFELDPAKDTPIRTNFNALNVLTSGDEATVEAAITLFTDEEHSDVLTFQLHKETSKWKVTHID